MGVVGQRRWARVFALAAAVALVGGPMVQRTGAEALLGNPDDILAREGITTPQDLGADPLDGLLYGDPTDQLELIAPPDGNNQGTAQLEYPLAIPSGRGGLQPDIALRYELGGGNGWVGLGWDVGASSITVDTEFGVPRYSATLESETYALDGATLSPTAVRSAYLPRRVEQVVGEGVVFTRRVDAEFDQVRRFGTKPGEYYWVVKDKAGNERYYGAIPSIDPATNELVVTRDPTSILADAAGREARWALAAEIDISLNVVYYRYEQVGYTFESWATTTGDATGGSQLWLREIAYTGSLVQYKDFEAPTPAVLDAAGREAAYLVEFLRDDDMTPVPARRSDIEIDARTGFLQSTPDLLRAVKVSYKPQGADVVRPRDPVRQYNLRYELGAFGKSRLIAVDVYGSEGATAPVGATETFTYYDEFVQGSGFATEQEWNTIADSLSEPLLFETAQSSVLGTSVGNSFDVHMYYGFNPTEPLKLGSFGGAWTVDGGGSDGLVEFFDINGDLLPDKVFRKEIGDPIRYRLNQGTASSPKFDDSADPPTVRGLEGLSYDISVGGGGALEAYLAATVQFSVSGQVNVGVNYFTDVNNDSLTDFVMGGKVYFNHLDSEGRPVFDPDSSLTPVPVDDASLNLKTPAEISEVLARRNSQTPVQDVVRRWIAPFGGTVAITGDVTWDPPAGGGHAAGDGVVVSIETGKAKLYEEAIAAADDPRTPQGVSSVAVTKGQVIFFRVRAGADADGYDTRWSPVITYLSLDATTDPPVPDVNGLDQAVYEGAADFTLAGRPGVAATMPLKGTVRVEGVLGKTVATTDEVDIVVLLDGTEVKRQKVPAGTVGDTPFSAEFDVAAPVKNGNAFVAQKVQVRVAVDSPIDLTVLDWMPTLYYTEAFAADGTKLPTNDTDTGEPLVQVDVPVDIDLYPFNTLVGPSAPWTSPIGQAATLEATITTSATDGGRAVLTVKDSNGLVAKEAIAIPARGAGTLPVVEVPLTLVEGEPYWFDLSLPGGASAGIVTAQSAKLTWNDGTDDQEETVDLVRHWTGGQDSYFPIGYRGWGYAGYNGDGAHGPAAIDPAAFTVDTSVFTNPQEPTSFDDPAYDNPAQGRAFAFFPARITIPDEHGDDVPIGVWRGATAEIVGGPAVVRTARPGGTVTVESNSDEERAPRLVSVAAPAFGLAAGFLVAGGGVTAGWEFGLVGYEDLNGDAYPDLVTPGEVKYTGPRGGYAETVSGQEALTVVSQDTGFSFSGGLGASLPEFKGKTTGQANTTNATAGGGSAPSSSSDSQKTSASEYGAQLGASFGISYAMGNPVLPDSDADIARAKQEIGKDAIKAYLEEKLADMNGDGLPDKVKVNNDGVWVRFNTGYGFQGDAVRWAVDGGFEQGESYSGSVGPTASFASPYFEWSGGVTYNESADLSIFAWDDLNGDGLLDRIRRIKKDATDPKLGIIDAAVVKVAFGSGAGILPEIDFGTFQSMHFKLQPNGVDAKNLIAAAQGKGTGFGFDISIPIGPLCPPTPACYVILNPGAHGEHSISTTPIQLTDVDGDGLPDSVRSESDGSMYVMRNTTGRTNLLRSVTNHLGGEIRLGYTRDGNTPAQPYPLWNLSSVQVDDNQPGDGPDTLVTTYRYSDNAFNSLERAFMGYETVVRTEREWVDDPADPTDTAPWDQELDPDALEAALRGLPSLYRVETHYRNATVFDTGLVIDETTFGRTGLRTTQSITTWAMVDPLTGDDVSTEPSDGDPAGVGLLDVAASPLMVKFEQRWFDAAGDLGRRTWNTFTYDPRGSIVRQVDVGDPAVDTDDVIAETRWADCGIAQAIPEHIIVFHPLPGGGREVLRERDGGSELAEEVGLCENLAVTVLGERTGPGQDDWVWTLLNFDAWGNYDCIWYNAPRPDPRTGGDACYGQPDPATQPNGYRVLYTFDPDRHTDIASVTDTHDLTSTATYHGETGYIASRTDPNLATTSYDYDELGRLRTIHGPYQQAAGDPATVTLSYQLARKVAGAGGADTVRPAYAIAEHHDAQHPGDTIDTARFIDGIGREIQTKQDGRVAGATRGTGNDVLVVGGAVEFDGLGRPVREWQPTVQPLTLLGTSNLGVFWPDTTADRYVGTTYDDAGLIKEMRAADGVITRRTYAYETLGDGSRVFVATTTDPQDRVTIERYDIRDNVIARDEVPPGVAALRTTFAFDPIGQLVGVTDNVGSVTTHAYDLLGRRAATTTPDAGLVELTYDGLGNIVARLDQRGREQVPPEPVVYRFDGDWLTFVDYPGTTPDVTYTYGVVDPPPVAGVTAEPIRGAGRVVKVQDGARTRTLAYDLLGAVASDTTIMKVRNLNASNVGKYTFTTSMEYDGLGRLQHLTYPDGERLDYSYDSGGLIASVTGVKGANTYPYVAALEYDEFLDRRFQQTGNGVMTAYTYFAGNRRLQTQKTTGPGIAAPVLQDLSYAYDLVGNVLTATNAVPRPSGKFKATTSSQTYTYDPFYRLEHATGTVAIKPNVTRSYTYDVDFDSAGRITRKVQADAGGAANRGSGPPTSYTLADYKYENGKPYQASEINGLARQYDANGNSTLWRPVGRGTLAMTWDTANRLTSVTDGLTTNAYQYDAEGKLAIVTGTNAETSFVNPWFTTEGGAKWKSIWVGDDRLAAKKVADVDYENQQFFFHKNLQGSTNVITIADGSQFARWEYFPGGQPWLTENSTTSKTPSWFTGAYLDPDFNLFNLGARWYDPGTEQMLSPDPLLVDDPGAIIEDPGLLAAYTYAVSSPARFIDLSGRDPTPAQVRSAAAGSQVPPQGMGAPAPPLPASPGGGAPTPGASATQQGIAGAAASTTAAASAPGLGGSAPPATSTGRFAGFDTVAWEKGTGKRAKQFELKPLLSFQWTRDPTDSKLHFSLTINPFYDIGGKDNRNRFGYQEPDDTQTSTQAPPPGGLVGGATTSPTKQANTQTNTPTKSDSSAPAARSTSDLSPPQTGLDDSDGH